MNEHEPQVPQETIGAGLQTETFEFIVHTRAGKFYWWLTGHPKKIVVAGLLFVLLAGYFLPRLYKDTSAESFIADDDPAVVYRKHVEEVFGLADPIIVAVTSSHPKGIFTPEGLNLVAELTEKIQRLEGVDPERVTSLYTENNVVGDVAGMESLPFWEGPVADQAQADDVRAAAFRFPLFMGSLVARDGTATLIVAELLDPDYGNEVYHQVLELGDAVENDTLKVYAAGEGAVAEYLGEYIDEDSRRLYPFIGLVIIAILLVAYRTAGGVFVPLFVVVAAAVAALGSMAAAGVPMYLITNALPVILIAIGVADGIHIMGQYYEEIDLRPFSKRREPVVRAMTELWKALLFTSLTDAIGFFALALGSLMPPMRAFGIYAGIGVAAAGLFSLLVMPALLTLLKPRKSPAFKSRQRKGHEEHVDRFGAIMGAVGRFVVRYPRPVMVASLVVVVAGVIGASQLEINYARINYFQEHEQIYQADQVINERLDGSNFIDVVITTPETDGLLNAAILRKIDELETFARDLPHVGGTTSIVDYVKQMNRAMFEDDDEMYRLPDDDDQIAQYFLLFTATGNPEELSKVVDYDYRLANVRIALKSGAYGDIKQAIEPLNDYIDAEFTDPELTASIAGRANVTYHWIDDLGLNHFLGVGAALFAVWACAALSFRSAVAGLFAATPVVISVLFIYAVMGFTGIWLGVGTSMFAAIGIGISVNFAIHTLHRTVELVRDYREELPVALTKLFPATGRALLFNFAAVFFGFSVLLSSQIRALTDFGFLVALATAISFIASVTTLPAMLLLFRPRFLEPRVGAEKSAEEYEVVTEDW